MLHRRTISAFVLATIVAVLALQSATAQSRDRVYYRDPGKEGKPTLVEGDTKESGAGVEVIDGIKKTKISAADMVRIDYGELAGIDRGSLVETDKDPAKNAFEFGKSLKSATTAPEKAKRYLSYREAYWLARAAGLKSGDEFVTAGKAAADKLAAFTKAYPRSWESWHTAREAARLYLQVGDSAAAVETVKLLAANTDLPADLQVDAWLLRAGYLFRMGDTKGASDAIAEAARNPKLEDLLPQKDRIAIFTEALKPKLPPPAPVKMKDESDDDYTARVAKLVGDAKAEALVAIPKVEAAIARAKDPVSRAIGYNLLGDLNMLHGLTRDAMWAYLWVDTVYSQDKDEQIMAVTRLIDVFKILKDEERTTQFEDRLQKLR